MRHLRINVTRHEFDGYDILQNISAVVNETDRIAVVGPNGAGKTTLMKIVTGEMKATE
jgi:ATP-binding cassette, subfamily F, member 3